MVYKNLFKKFFSKLNVIIPKLNIIVFNSNPDFSDNAYVLYKYIIENRKDIISNFKIYWACNEKSIKFNGKVPVGKTIYKKSIIGLFIFFLAKYVICTHNYFYDLKSGGRQKIINLWHGCGYKKLINDRKYYRGDCTFVTSYIYKAIQNKELNIPIDNIYVTGLARNDKLFIINNNLIKFGIDRNNYKKILIWLPTYRKSVINELGVSGDINNFCLNSMTDVDLFRLTNVLEENGILLLIKPHPLEDVKENRLTNTNNIMFIDNKKLANVDIDLYDILQETDGLISDYSSVIVDYLLLDKPIALLCGDLDSYKNNRGFVFDNIVDYLPGPMITNLDSLIDYINDFDVINHEWLECRRKIKKMLHFYSDNNNCKRITECIFSLKEDE